MLHWLLHWLAVHTGTVNESGPYYGFFSGFGSDIGELELLGIAATVYRKHNCHSPWCLRLGHHHLEDGTPVCRKHHPDLPDRRRSLAELHEAHHEAKAHRGPR